MELGHFDKHFVENTRKIGSVGKNFGFFSPSYNFKFSFKSLLSYNWVGASSEWAL